MDYSNNEKISILIFVMDIALEHVLAQAVQQVQLRMLELSLTSLLSVMKRFLQGLLSPEKSFYGNFPVVCAEKVLDLLGVTVFLVIIPDE